AVVGEHSTEASPTLSRCPILPDTRELVAPIAMPAYRIPGAAKSTISYIDLTAHGSPGTLARRHRPAARRSARDERRFEAAIFAVAEVRRAAEASGWSRRPRGWWRRRRSARAGAAAGSVSRRSARPTSRSRSAGSP